ncbi:MAG: hypothetical protein DI582_04570 [Azospirillum brasilense]|nr:MAG: hypothetical protein DI582_04570 [Azospirillum brasilense]
MLMIEQQQRGSAKGGLSANWAVREVDHLFSRFARYTRFVLYSKWFLGVFGLVLIIILVIWPLVAGNGSGTRMSFVGTENVNAGASSAPTMDNPIYEGVDKQGRQFKITGARAIQQTGDAIVVEQVEGQLLMKGDAFVALTAQRANYRQKAENIELQGDVTVTHSGGYIFTTPSATISTQTMDVVGQEQVTGEGPMGNLLATGFKIMDNGNVVQFGGVGRVNVTIERTKNPA